MLLAAKAFVFGDYIDTDRVYPSQFLIRFEPEVMAAHAMEGCDPEFPEKIKQGGIVVAGKSFGTGSAREQAAQCLKYAGVKCLVAESFARSFFRNAVNVGLPLVILPGAGSFAKDGDELEVDAASATVRNLTTGETRRGTPLPPMCQAILAQGGAVAYFSRFVKTDPTGGERQGQA